jgi:outer membrane protein TolC
MQSIGRAAFDSASFEFLFMSCPVRSIAEIAGRQGSSPVGGKRRSRAASIFASIVGRSVFLVALLAAPSQVLGQSLDMSLRQSLDSSVDLQADSQRQAATVARLRGSIDAFMPTVLMLDEHILNSHISYSPDTTATTIGANPLQNREPDIWGIQANLNLFDGFKRYNDVQAARWLSEAGRQLGVDKRQQLLLETTMVYLGVLRDRAIVVHRREQIAGVQAVAQRAAARFELRDVTRTDLALARSRLEEARGALRQAEVNLEKARIEFTRLTGAAPGKLVFPPSPEALLPHSAEELRAAIRTGSPKLAAMRMVANAAESNANAAWAALSPRVDLEFVHSIESNIAPGLQKMNDTTTKLSLKIPLYMPGVLPQIQEATAVKREKAYESIDAEQKALTAAQSLMADRKATIARIAIARRRAEALRDAARSLDVERAAGYRTVTDALNVQAELAEARIAMDLLNYESDHVGFALAAALGRIGEPGASRPVASLR